LAKKNKTKKNSLKIRKWVGENATTKKKKRGRAKKTEIVTRSLRRSRQTKREILFASCQGNNSQGELEIN